MNDRKVRVRFAPSPTGPLHMGGVRTALFNYLFAKKHNGDFLLRIEDTDQTRYVPGAEDYIMESLAWCGLKVDEGIREGGPHGPYRQSERKEIYKEYAEALVKSGNAYYAFDSAEELDKLRHEYESKGENFIYNASTRSSLKNSFTLSDEEVQRLLNSEESFVVRFCMPDNEVVTENDIIRGEVSFNTGLLDDKVLYKSDGMPTYHLANVVDDHLMEITHVIRGEEWLSSMPLHVLLYRALGWSDTMPRFAHLPLILKPVGKGKLSKRDGDKLGFPVFPLLWNDPFSGEVSRGYREDGYFPEAFINMLAFLGWNPGTEQEFFSLEELVENFSLERVGKSGSKFDPEKTKWFNHQYLIRRSDEQIAEQFEAILKSKGIADYDNAKVIRICGLLKERANFVSEIWNQGYFFFQAPTEYDAQVVKKRWKAETPQMMKEIAEFLNSVDNWDTAPLKEAFSAFVTGKGWGFGAVMNAFRLCLVGAGIGPDLFDICNLIGKDETINRINRALNQIRL
ncbi:MAG: glutamate--tRNA ligase [Bacteroidota bacterium]|nr:glutamate--tRNA ligase [Bacteroidota bacterium]MDP4204380.1 glutamate--tRNA ligase [Bacteroidota bacterium]